MIDRKARDEMAQVLRAYMSEEITASQLDDALRATMAATDDQTVAEIGHALWLFYDDFKDHHIIANKAEWDYFNRVLLLLASAAEIAPAQARRYWHPLQLAAAVLLLGFVVLALRVGFGEHLFAYALPFGPLSMLLAWLNSRVQRQRIGRTTEVLTPFPSFGSLRAVRRQVPGMVRTRYPTALAGRRIRHPVMALLAGVPAWVLWCLFAPVVLCFQMLPDSEPGTTMTLPLTAPGVTDRAGAAGS